MVRGKTDAIFVRFMEQLRTLAPHMVNLAEVRDPFAEIMDNLILLETYEGNDINQGTGFLLNGIGFVTCAHVLGTDVKNTTAYSRHDPTGFPVTIVCRDDELDLAILKIDMEGISGLMQGDSRPLKVGDPIKLTGFPNHNFGDSGILSQGTIIGRRHIANGERLLISENIIFGNSGGPVLDVHDKVIGIAVTGAADEEESRRTEAHGVIPISVLQSLVKGLDAG